MRFELFSWLLNNDGLPNGCDPALRNQGWGFSYAFAPYISQILAAYFVKLLCFFGVSNSLCLFFGRSVSGLFICGYTIFVILISRRLFKYNCYRWVFISLCTLLPQILYLGGYINNDSFSLFCVSFIVFCWLYGLDKSWNVSSCILLGLSNGLCLLSYYFAYGYLLCSAIVFIWSSFINKYSFKDFILKALLVFTVAFCVSGWFFIRNYIIYNGDFLGLKTPFELSSLYAVDNLKPQNRVKLYQSGISLITMLFGPYSWLSMTIESFIGKFGYMTVLLPYKLSVPLLLIYFVGCFGIVFTAVVNRRCMIKNQPKFLDYDLVDNKFSNYRILILTVFLISISIPFVVSIIYSYFFDFSPQGRYIITISIPLFYMLTIGIRNVLNSLFAKKWQTRTICFTICFILIIVAVFSVRYIIYSL